MNEKNGLEIIKIQLALFFKNEFKGNVFDISEKIKENKFGLSDPINFAIGKDELGKITGSTILKIKSNTEEDSEENVNLSYSINNNRLDIYTSHDNLIKNIETNLVEIFNIFKEYSILINRIGFVVYYGNTSLQNQDFINLFKDTNIKGGALQNISEINFLVNIKKDFSFENEKPIIINDRTQYLNASKTENGILLPGFIIMRDVNTAPENTSLVIDTDKSINFIKEARKKVEEFLFNQKHDETKI